MSRNVKNQKIEPRIGTKLNIGDRKGMKRTTKPTPIVKLKNLDGTIQFFLHKHRKRSKHFAFIIFKHKKINPCETRININKSYIIFVPNRSSWS